MVATQTHPRHGVCGGKTGSRCAPEEREGLEEEEASRALELGIFYVSFPNGAVSEAVVTGV